MKKIGYLLLPVIAIAGGYLSSCNERKPTYDVVWKNWDGTVLETDNYVIQGTMPKYNSDTPTKVSDENYKYTFIGWDKEIEKVKKDTVYQAVFKEVDYDYNIEIDYNDGKTPNATYKFDEDHLNSYNYYEIKDIFSFTLTNNKNAYDYQLDDGTIIETIDEIVEAIKNGNKKFTLKYYARVNAYYCIESDEVKYKTGFRELPDFFGTALFPEKVYLDEDYSPTFNLANDDNILSYDAYYSYYEHGKEDYGSNITGYNKIDSFENLEIKNFGDNQDVMIKVFIKVNTYKLNISDNLEDSNVSYVYAYLYKDLTVLGIQGEWNICWGTPVTLNTEYDEYEFDGYYDKNGNLLSKDKLYTFTLKSSTDITARWILNK